MFPCPRIYHEYHPRRYVLLLESIAEEQANALLIKRKMTGKWMEGREMVCGELREIVKNAIAQDVYKVSLQFQKFITEANEEADK